MRKRFGLSVVLFCHICGLILGCAESPKDIIKDKDLSPITSPIENPVKEPADNPAVTPPPVLIVQATDPDHGLGGVPITSTLSINFNLVIDEATLTSNTFWLHNVVAHKKVASEIRYNAMSRTATLIPEGLEYDSHYLLLIHHTIKSITGMQLDKTYEISFFTESRPEIGDQLPLNASTDININTIVRVSFIRPMNIESINSSSFVLQDAAGSLIDAEVSATEMDATLVPKAPLNSETLYYAVLKNTLQLSTGNLFSTTDIKWKFTTSATSSLTKHFGSSGNDQLMDSAVDSENNTIIVGSTDNALSGFSNSGLKDIIIAKFDAMNSILWQKQIGTKEDDFANNIAVDEQNNIYIIGDTSGNLDPAATVSASDIFVMKLDPAGEQQWLVQLSSTGEQDNSQSLFYQNGSLIISGMTSGSFDKQVKVSDYDYFFSSINVDDGKILWTVQGGLGSQRGEPQPITMTLDIEGNIYLLVKTIPQDTGAKEFGNINILKYRNNSLLWNQTVQSDIPLWDVNKLLVVENKILLSVQLGFDFGNPSDTIEPGTYLMALDADNKGKVLWKKNLFPNRGIPILALESDNENNYYLTSEYIPYSADFPVSPDLSAYVTKYDKNDNVLWNANLVTKNGFSTYILGIAVDSTGTLHLSGNVNGGGVEGNASFGNNDIFIAVLDSTTGNVK